MTLTICSAMPTPSRPVKGVLLMPCVTQAAHRIYTPWVLVIPECQHGQQTYRKTKARTVTSMLWITLTLIQEVTQMTADIARNQPETCTLTLTQLLELTTLDNVQVPWKPFTFQTHSEIFEIQNTVLISLDPPLTFRTITNHKTPTIISIKDRTTILRTTGHRFSQVGLWTIA